MHIFLITICYLNINTRKNHGCDTQLLNTVIDFVNYYDDNIQVDLAVLDFSKAFDVVSHTKLLAKITAMGIHCSTREWIASWLSDRKLFVTVNGDQSNSRK